MAQVTNTLGFDLDEQRLAMTVAELLSNAATDTVGVKILRRAPSPFATLFPAEVVTVGLRDGRELHLFLKHLGSEQADHPDKRRRDREVRTYEELFRRTDHLPIPRYHGARWNTVTARHELYLEYVDDWSLKYHELTHWFTAARRLADLHAHFARVPGNLSGCEFLLRLDQSYFSAWAQRAVTTVADIIPAAATRLKELIAAYQPLITLLSDQPATLVHNDLSPKNVIAHRVTAPASIYFVDWEMAGIGCGLLDLVHLKYGLEPESERGLIDAYRSQLASNDLLPPDEHGFRRLLAACELHKTLYRLAHSVAWQLPPEHVSRWVTDVERFMRQAGHVP